MIEKLIVLVIYLNKKKSKYFNCYYKCVKKNFYNRFLKPTKKLYFLRSFSYILKNLQIFKKEKRSVGIN